MSNKKPSWRKYTIAAVIILLCFLTGYTYRVMIWQSESHIKGDRLEFLTGIPEFRDLNLSTTESELQRHIKRFSLSVQRTVEKDGGVSYNLFTGKGENIIVMFDNNHKCIGIQRMSPISLNLNEESELTIRNLI
jgi:hypothetical protein